MGVKQLMGGATVVGSSIDMHNNDVGKRFMKQKVVHKSLTDTATAHIYTTVGTRGDW